MKPKGVCELHLSACGLIESCEGMTQSLFGETPTALRGQLLPSRLGAKSRASWREFWREFWRDGTRRDAVAAAGTVQDLTLARADGAWTPVCARLRAADAHEPGCVVLTLRALTASPLRGGVPAPEALHDALTDLPNRRGARELIESTVVPGAYEGDSISVACVDLDNFRSVNEGYGHDVAESVLRAVGDALRRCSAGFGCVCRTAGDEFLVVHRGRDSAEDMREFVPALMRAIHEPLDIGGEQLIVTASVGVATRECRDVDFDALMQRASHAMSRAKRLGRNTWYFAPAQILPDTRQQAIKTRLYRAIQLGALELHYQPILDLASGQLRSFEALMRWDDAQLGRVSPGVFIPVAEECGLIASLGSWTLRQACRQAARWRRMPGCRHAIAVNVSALQLQRGEFEVELRAMLESECLEPGMLELEVTESALIHDAAHLAEMSARLRALGVGVAIDDFGTGYSNLLYLKHFHPSKIKIDRSFVQGIATSAEDRAIVRAVIDMAHAIGARVVAEGVESAQVCAELRRLGCDEAQGYLFARPCASADVEAWLGSTRIAALDLQG
jgi:diguanylate cyclase (GGDEF)-like protein